jgi:hypothetical protein
LYPILSSIADSQKARFSRAQTTTRWLIVTSQPPPSKAIAIYIPIRLAEALTKIFRHIKAELIALEMECKAVTIEDETHGSQDRMLY